MSRGTVADRPGTPSGAAVRGVGDLLDEGVRLAVEDVVALAGWRRPRPSGGSDARSGSSPGRGRVPPWRRGTSAAAPPHAVATWWDGRCSTPKPCPGRGKARSYPPGLDATRAAAPCRTVSGESFVPSRIAGSAPRMRPSGLVMTGVEARRAATVHGSPPSRAVGPSPIADCGAGSGRAISSRYASRAGSPVPPRQFPDGGGRFGDGRVALPACVRSLRLISERPWRPDLDLERRHLGSVVTSLGESPPAARNASRPDEGRDHRPLPELPRNGSDHLDGAFEVELVEVLLPQHGPQFALELAAQLARIDRPKHPQPRRPRLAACGATARAALDPGHPGFRAAPRGPRRRSRESPRPAA